MRTSSWICTVITSVLFLLGSAAAQTALYSASDSFSQSALSASWTVLDGGMEVNGGTVSGISGGWNAMVRNDFRCATSTDLGCNQSSQATLANGGAWTGLILRASGSGSYYRAFTNGIETYIETATGVNILHRGDIAWQAGDTMTFRVSGTNFELLQNGVLVARFVDNTLPTGGPGVMTYGTNAQLSSWSGTQTLGSPGGTQLLAVRSQLDPNCSNCSLVTEPFDGTGANHIAIIGYSHPNASLSCTDSQGNLYSPVSGSPWDDNVLEFTIRTFLLQKVNPSVAPFMTISCTQGNGPQGLALWAFVSKGAVISNNSGLRAFALAANPNLQTAFSTPSVNASLSDLIISDYQATDRGTIYTSGGTTTVSAAAPYLSLATSLDFGPNPDLYNQVAYTYAAASGATDASYTSSAPMRGVGVIFAVSGASPFAALSTSSLSWTGVNVGATKSTAVSLKNTGRLSLRISSINISGATFSQTNNCPSSLGVGATCTINVTFAPKSRGTYPGSLWVNDNAVGSPHQVSLSGTAVAPIASLSRTSMDFGYQPLGITSTGQVVTLSNTGDATLNISGYQITANYTQTHSCGATLAPGASCTISVTLKPSSVGSKPGTLTINDNDPTTPGTVALSGTGVSYNLTASLTSLTVTHGSSVSTAVTALPLGGSFPYPITFTCSGLPNAASCSFNPSSVTPGATGASTTVTITTAANTKIGSFNVTVNGAYGTLKDTVVISLTVR